MKQKTKEESYKLPPLPKKFHPSLDPVIPLKFSFFQPPCLAVFQNHSTPPKFREDGREGRGHYANGLMHCIFLLWFLDIYIHKCSNLYRKCVQLSDPSFSHEIFLKIYFLKGMNIGVVKPLNFLLLQAAPIFYNRPWSGHPTPHILTPSQSNYCPLILMIHSMKLSNVNSMHERPIL